MLQFYIADFLVTEDMLFVYILEDWNCVKNALILYQTLDDDSAFYIPGTNMSSEGAPQLLSSCDNATSFVNSLVSD